MFAKQPTIRTLHRLARERAKARSIRIPLHLSLLFRNLIPGGILLLASVGFGIACVKISSQDLLPAVGGLGVALLAIRWDRAFADSLPAPCSFSFFPASAERIWNARFKLYLRTSSWFAVGALAIITCLVIDHRISLASALASIPSAFALAVWMITLPLLLTLLFPGFRPGFITLLVVLLVGASVGLADALPAVSASSTNLLVALTWSNPAGWFYLFETSTFDPAARFFFNAAALIAGILLIRPIASALEHRVILREMAADESDSRVSSGAMAEPEINSAPQSRPQPAVTPLGQARALLSGEAWGIFPGPQTLMEKLFWRTLNERQRLVAQFIWPLGLRWKIAHRALYRFAGGFLAVAGALRLLSFTGAGWFAVAIGAIIMFFFAPILPGYEFVFQPLLLGGRSAARCQLFPVSISEICRVLHRCQTIRAAGACWIGAAYGALVSIIMGQNFYACVSAGLSIVFLSFAFHPFVLITKLTNLTQNGGRRWASIPNVLTLIVTVILGVPAIILGPIVIAAAAASGDTAPKSFYVMPAMCASVFAFAMAFRLLGWGLLQIYLLMIERSWLDAVVKLPNHR